MIDSTLFEKLWQESEPCRDDMAAFWNRRAPSYNQHINEEASRRQRQELMHTVARRAGLDQQSCVLDLGCGPGGQALALASLAGSVEAFDIAPTMIELAQKNALAARCDTVHFQVLDWDRADIDALGWRNKFHLVLASRTPAVHNRPTLEKMLACCRGYGCIITHVDTWNSVREELKKVVPWDEALSRINISFYSTFNLLWLMGYHPSVEYIERQWESNCPVDDAELMFTRSFEKQGPLQAAHKKALRQKLEALAVDGRVHEKAYSRLAIMFWSMQTGHNRA